MDPSIAKDLIAELGAEAKVIDVGGGASAFPRADYVIDAVPYQQRGALGDLCPDVTPHFSESTWVVQDLCEHKRWPFEDKFFDFAICSHLLEDVRDPIWICSELCRIAKAGYIEFPSRALEQSLGVEHPCYAGYYHHRWLVSVERGGLEFRHKPHILHATRSAIVARVKAWQMFNPYYSIASLRWSDSFAFREVLEFDECAMVKELAEFATSARARANLVIARPIPALDRAKRFYYYARLRFGRV